jgi:Family of unknown function (DUF6941)
MAKKKAPAKKRAGRNPPTPDVMALIACHGIGRDVSNRTTIYGVFDNMFIDQFPGRVEFGLYARFANGAGDYGISIEISGPRGYRPFKEDPSTQVTMQKGKPSEIHFRLGAVAKYAGEYRIGLKVNGRPMGAPCSIQIREKGASNG